MVTFFISFLLYFINEHTFANSISDEKNSSVEIIPNERVLSHKNQKFIGLKITLEKDWKTYWKNPGDAGIPLNINFSEKEKISNYEVLYPFPKKFLDHGVITNGYEKEVIYPIKINFKEDVKKFKSNLIVDYLICNKICIPKTEIKKINIDLKKNTKSLIDSEVYDYFKKVPKSDGEYFSLDLIDLRSKSLLYKFKNNVKKKDIKVFIFNEDEIINFETSFSRKNDELFLEILSDNNLEKFSKPIYLSFSDGKIFEEHKKYIPQTPDNAVILYYILLAFLGGLILNFMPCVLPVLSLKVYSLVSLKNSSVNELRKNGILIIFGIIFSFLVLSAFVIFLKSFGHQVGWGFQFQNLYFILFLTLIILIFGLNLLGFFEIILPNKINNFFHSKILSESYISNFLSGAFSTLLATPCSAPFLGTAVGFSMMASNLTIILIFFCISLGFAFPYIMLILLPKLRNFLPKPGSWMENFKVFLGLLLILTFSWLLYLLNIENVYIFGIVSLIIFISIFRNSNLFNIISGSLSVSLLFFILFSFSNENKKSWSNFDEETLSKYLNSNNLIILDFTADWCVTCQVNKISTLNSNEVNDFFEENNVKLMRADWTDKNKKILEFMSQFNRYGIPLNIIYGPKNKKGKVLPEILTKTIVINGLDELK